MLWLIGVILGAIIALMIDRPNQSPAQTIWVETIMDDDDEF